MIRRKYPTSHKTIPDTKLGVALVGRGLLQMITKVELLAYHLVLPTYHISGYFPLLTEIDTNKLPQGGK